MDRTGTTKTESSREIGTLRNRTATLENLLVRLLNGDERYLSTEDERKYETIFESVDDIIVLLDDAGRVTHVNEKLPEILGYSREKLLGKTLESLPNVKSLKNAVMRKSLDILNINFLKRLNGESIPPYEIEMVKKDGGSIFFEINAQVMKKDNKIIGDLVILRDISEHKSMDQALNEREEYLRKVVEASSEGFILYDGETVVDITEKGANKLGYERSEMIGKNGCDFIATEYLNIFGENITDNSSKPHEAVFYKKDGLPLHVEFRITSIIYRSSDMWLIAFSDITLQRQYEDFMENIVVNAPMSMSIVQDGKFKFVNRQFCLDTGYTESEILAMDFMQFIHLEDQTLCTNNTIQMLMGKRREPFEFRIINKSGDVRWVLQSSTLVPYNNGFATLSMYQDITEKKESEAALRESEQKYKALADSITDVFFAMDNQLRYVHWNKASEKLIGITSEDAIGKHLYDIFPKDEATRRAEEIYLKAIKTRQPQHLGNRYRIRDKDYVFDISAYPSQDGVSVFVKDITEQTAAEDEIRDNQARFRELARLLPLGIWETDANGFLTYTNEEAMKNYGYSRQDSTPISYLQALAPQDRQRAAENTQKILKSENVGSTEYISMRKDGSFFPSRIYASAISRDGKSVGMRGIVVDITEQKIAEKRLEQAAHEWRVTFDSLTDMVCIIDKKFKIVRVNKAYADMFNKKPQELLGKICYKLMNRECPHLDCPHEKMLQTCKSTRAEFFEPVLGTYVEVSMSPIFNEIGEAWGSVHIIRDISERKQMEQQLMLADRLASVGELASGVAHELNNPLTSIIGFSQLLTEGEIPANIKEDLSLIKGEAKRAADIVKNLLTFARKHTAVKQAIKIHNVIEDVLRLRAYEQKVNNIKVIKDFAADLPEIMVDYFQMQQVFLNIIINAEFFMIKAHHGGILTVTTEGTADIVRVSVTDDGTGINQDNMNRIFDPFFTTKDVGKGTGLGLSICHGIIAEHGGKIYAQSELGKGATFIIELPINGYRRPEK